MYSRLNSIRETIDYLQSQEIVALNFCCFESAEGGDVEHYQLLKSGEKASHDCFDVERFPLISDYGKKIIERFIQRDGVALHPLKLIKPILPDPLLDF